MNITYHKPGLSGLLMWSKNIEKLPIFYIFHVNVLIGIKSVPICFPELINPEHVCTTPSYKSIYWRGYEDHKEVNLNGRDPISRKQSRLRKDL